MICTSLLEQCFPNFFQRDPNLSLENICSPKPQTVYANMKQLQATKMTASKLITILSKLNLGSTYFTTQMLVATELLCRQSNIRSHGMTQYKQKGHFVKNMLSCSWCDGEALQLLCQWLAVRLSPCRLSFCFFFAFFKAPLRFYLQGLVLLDQDLVTIRVRLALAQYQVSVSLALG